jgi:rare lipoprotein A
VSRGHNAEMACHAHPICGYPTESPRFIGALAGAICMGLVLAVTGYSAEKVVDHRPVLETRFGDATIYASHFEGRKTASGRIFRGDEPMAAHRTYPFGTLVRVTYLRNKRSVNVVIVDRGPYGKNHKEGAIIDLSSSAAKKLGMVRAGQAHVRIEVLEWGKGRYRN